uniref:Exopolysaccharide biosynthesis protein n=1 Tax=Desulfobacca acetoxidans TaxID=60893 RepID=A0A7C3V565_9BACT
MDFLDKALEKAKAAKPQAGKPQAEEGPTSPGLREVVPPTPPPLSGAGAAVGEILYTTTRTVPVNADWLRSQRIVTGASDDKVGEAYKLLRTQILHRTKADNKNLLMLTGPQPGEGKTLTAINLAVSLSQEIDKTVLLVDADLRRPTIHEYLGLPAGPGLGDYLTGAKTIPELLVHPEGFGKFVILPGGRPIAEAAELISSPMMMELVEELKHFYPDRYVLFDLPPMLSFADALAFAPLVDGIILVVEKGKTPREDIQRCLELLKDFPLLGTVLNKVSPTDSGYYYPEYQRHNERPADKKSWWGWLRR